MGSATNSTQEVHANQSLARYIGEPCAINSHPHAFVLQLLLSTVMLHFLAASVAQHSHVQPGQWVPYLL